MSVDFSLYLHMSSNVRKHVSGLVRTENIQISLRIRAVWSESLQDAIMIAKYANFLHVENEDCDQSAKP